MYPLLITLLGLIIFQTLDNFTVDLDQYFVSVGALAGAVVIVTEFFKKLTFIGNSPSWVKQILSWVISIAGSFAGSYFDLGVFADLNTTYIIIYGFATGLIANGIFDFALVQAFLNLFHKK